MRSIGTSSSSAVVGVVLAHMTTTFGTTTLPSENGFRTALIIGGGAAVIALTITAFIPGRRPATLAAASEPETTAKAVPDHPPAT
jgi:hypothetical protein